MNSLHMQGLYDIKHRQIVPAPNIIIDYLETFEVETQKWISTYCATCTS